MAVMRKEWQAIETVDQLTEECIIFTKEYATLSQTVIDMGSAV
jgi:hypothetical protein